MAKGGTITNKLMCLQTQSYAVVSLIDVVTPFELNKFFYFFNIEQVRKKRATRFRIVERPQQKSLLRLLFSKAKHALTKHEDVLDFDYELTEKELALVLSPEAYVTSYFYNFYLQNQKSIAQTLSYELVQKCCQITKIGEINVRFAFLSLPTVLTSWSKTTNDFIRWGLVDQSQSDYCMLRDCTVFRATPEFDMIKIERCCISAIKKMSRRLGASLYDQAPHDLPQELQQLLNVKERKELLSSELVQLFLQLCHLFETDFQSNNLIVWRITERGGTTLEKLHFDIRSATIWLLPLVYNDGVADSNEETMPLRVTLTANSAVFGCREINNVLNYYANVQVGNLVPFPQIILEIQIDTKNSGIELMDKVNPSLVFICQNEFIRTELMFFFLTWIKLLRR